jgi:hypothetical protein
MAKAKKKTKKLGVASKASRSKKRVKKASRPSGSDDGKDWTRALVKALWPQERDYMERPERYRYVRKLLPSSSCVFCAAAKSPKDKDTLVLAKD